MGREPGLAGSSARCRPRRPTSSSTSSTRVTSTAPSRIIRWHPADWPDVTGPGTAMTGLPNARASAAVRWAPLRNPASTTTVPPARPAMSRLRTRKRWRAGTEPGGYSETIDAGRGDPVEQGLVRRGIAAIDAAGQHGDSGAARGQRATVGGAVDADRSPGHHREPGCRQPGTELPGHVRAVSGGRPRPDDRGGLITEFVERARPTNPQRDRGRQIAPRGLRFRPDPAASGPGGRLIQQAAAEAAIRPARHRRGHARPAVIHRSVHDRPVRSRLANPRPCARSADPPSPDAAALGRHRSVGRMRRSPAQ